jgi:single-strand DNA-binding protein
VAVNRRFGNKNGEEQQADFINVTAWRQQAELVTRYFKKGSSICVVGSIQTRNWTDNDGNKRYATDVVADEVVFVDSKNESQPTTAPTTYVPSAYTQPVMEEITEDEDLPF